MGYSKRRGVVIVDNNAVSQTAITAPTIREQTMKEMTRNS